MEKHGNRELWYRAPARYWEDQERLLVCGEHRRRILLQAGIPFVYGGED